ncbi:MAG TPA: hypothetical protein VH951_08305, partial [Dehalococcoidia bacterium]
MSLATRPFRAEDIDAASRLLSERHARDRLREPRLPRRYEDSARCRTLIETLPNAEGVVAERDGRMAGYLLAECTPPALQDRRAFLPLEGHAIGADEDGETYRRMYAGLAPALVRRGLFDHQVLMPADDETAVEAWFSLCFGEMLHVASRALSPVDANDGSFEIRPCGVRDVDAAAALLLDLEWFHARPPVFRPTMATIESSRAEIAGDIDSADSIVLLAYRDSRPLGLFFARRPRSMPIGRFDKTLAVLEVYVAPEARAGGVGTAMLAR